MKNFIGTLSHYKKVLFLSFDKKNFSRVIYILFLSYSIFKIFLICQRAFYSWILCLIRCLFFVIARNLENYKVWWTLKKPQNVEKLVTIEYTLEVEMCRHKSTILHFEIIKIAFYVNQIYHNNNKAERCQSISI